MLIAFTHVRILENFTILVTYMPNKCRQKRKRAPRAGAVQAIQAIYKPYDMSLNVLQVLFIATDFCKPEAICDILRALFGKQVPA